MPLSLDEHADFVNTTISNFQRFKWADIAQEWVSLVSAKVYKDYLINYSAGGPSIVWDVNVKYEDNVRESGLYDTDQLATEDTMEQATVPWRKTTTNYTYDLDLDAFQSDRETIVRMLTYKRHGMKQKYAEFMETRMWTTASSSSQKRIWGVPHYIVKDTTTSGSYLGGNPTGFTDTAGISSVTQTGWRNWAGVYATVTSADLVDRIKRAIRKTSFEAPFPHPTLGYQSAGTEIYVTLDTIQSFERLAETRNENLGSDVARYMNQVVVAGHPVTYCDWLEENTTDDPVYGVCWKELRPFAKRGKYMKETRPMPAPHQHSVVAVHMDTWTNWLAFDRRKQWVLSKAA